ncbi:hypothetical protein GCM10010350_30890 [Streptomyces galilaeus]|nr:hypothetical protein GCM10010350_30890 [Streptomyces galilaeus]
MASRLGGPRPGGTTGRERKRHRPDPAEGTGRTGTAARDTPGACREAT